MRPAHGLALVAAALGVFAPAASAASDDGVLSMTPAKRDLRGKPPLTLSKTRISNSTKLTMEVTTFPVLLVQKLDGTFTFNETPRELNAARLIFPVEPRKFTLRPDEEKFLRSRWALLPRGAKAAYMGLVVQGVPTSGGKGVGSVLRLLGTNFFTLPGKWEVDGRLTGLRGEQAGPQQLRFFPRVRNTGQIHSQPVNGRCRVTNGSNVVVVENLKYGDGVILPGAEREYPVLIQKPTVLPAGTYVMRCTQRFGKRASTRELEFRLSGPNTLPTAELKLGAVGASGEIGGAADVDAVVRNVGSKAADAVLTVQIDRVVPGKPPRRVARERFGQGSIGPRSSKDASMSLGDLTDGNYRATVVLLSKGAQLDQKTVDFAATEPTGIFDWLADHWWWLLILLAVLLILWLIWRQRRRQRELEEELELARMAAAGGEPPAPPAPAPREPAPPAPVLREPAPTAPGARASTPASGDGRVDVNAAGVEELMRLPGVGRRAAERIVAHREANGPFASLDDLADVEGFHSERIRRIADGATV